MARVVVRHGAVPVGGDLEFPAQFLGHDLRPDLPAIPDRGELPDFSEIYFNSAYAGRGLDFVAEGGAADTVLNMVEDGTTVATTTIETPGLYRVLAPAPRPSGRVDGWGAARPAICAWVANHGRPRPAIAVMRLSSIRTR